MPQSCYKLTNPHGFLADGSPAIARGRPHYGVHGGVAWRRLSRRPITMVVPFPPGPALDLVARLVTASGVTLGQTVVTEPAPAPTA